MLARTGDVHHDGRHLRRVGSGGIKEGSSASTCPVAWAEPGGVSPGRYPTEEAARDVLARLQCRWAGADGGGLAGCLAADAG